MEYKKLGSLWKRMCLKLNAGHGNARFSNLKELDRNRKSKMCLPLNESNCGLGVGRCVVVLSLVWMLQLTGVRLGPVSLPLSIIINTYMHAHLSFLYFNYHLAIFSNISI